MKLNLLPGKSVIPRPIGDLRRLCKVLLRNWVVHPSKYFRTLFHFISLKLSTPLMYMLKEKKNVEWNFHLMSHYSGLIIEKNFITHYSINLTLSTFIFNGSGQKNCMWRWQYQNFFKVSRSIRNFFSSFVQTHEGMVLSFNSTNSFEIVTSIKVLTNFSTILRVQ